MSRYVALLDHDGDMFGVTVPDAPGCTAMGKSHDEALHNAGEALAEWADDLVADAAAVPAPRVEELLADDEVRAALAAGAVLAMVPLLQERGRAVRANIS